jgi:hypothetical protein
MSLSGGTLIVGVSSSSSDAPLREKYSRFGARVGVLREGTHSTRRSSSSLQVRRLSVLDETLLLLFFSPAQMLSFLSLSQNAHAPLSACLAAQDSNTGYTMSFENDTVMAVATVMYPYFGAIEPYEYVGNAIQCAYLLMRCALACRVQLFVSFGFHLIMSTCSCALFTRIRQTSRVRSIQIWPAFTKRACVLIFKRPFWVRTEPKV